MTMTMTMTITMIMTMTMTITMAMTMTMTMEMTMMMKMMMMMMMIILYHGGPGSSVRRPFTCSTLNGGVRLGMIMIIIRMMMIMMMKMSIYGLDDRWIILWTMMMKVSLVREARRRIFLLIFGHCKNCHDPPPPVFLETYGELFLKQKKVQKKKVHNVQI